MNGKDKTKGTLTRLSDEELAKLLRAARITDPEERRAAIKRATTGLRVGVEVTRSFYRLG